MRANQSWTFEGEFAVGQTYRQRIHKTERHEAILAHLRSSSDLFIIIINIIIIIIIIIVSKTLVFFVVDKSVAVIIDALIEEKLATCGFDLNI